MNITEIRIPPSLEQWLADFKTTSYYASAIRTVDLELQKKSTSSLHDTYENQLLSNVLGRMWMQLWADPELAMVQIMSYPADSPLAIATRNDFLCSLCQLEYLEIKNATMLKTLTSGNFPRNALRNYVDKINTFVSEDWGDMINALWDRLMDQDDIVRYIKGRKGELYSKNKVYHIIAFLILKKVYKPGPRQEEISYLLEDGDKKEISNHRSQLSIRLPQNIADIVEKCVDEVG